MVQLRKEDWLLFEIILKLRKWNIQLKQHKICSVKCILRTNWVQELDVLIHQSLNSLWFMWLRKKYHSFHQTFLFEKKFFLRLNNLVKFNKYNYQILILQFWERSIWCVPCQIGRVQDPCFRFTWNFKDW